MKRTDIVVLGSGAAGLVAAATASAEGGEVVLITKGQVGRSGATVTISGDISVDGRTARELLHLEGDAADSIDTFFEDTVVGGKFLNDQPVVEAMVEEIGPEVRKLMDLGLRVSGPLWAPGHRYARGVWASGMEILQILSTVALASKVKFLEEFYATDLLADTGEIVGVAGIDLRSGEVIGLEAKAVIIATGGGMMLYPFQTAPEELVGDGYLMALKTGAELVDMEMVQWLPCVLVDPPVWRGIQFPWLLGPQSGVHAWLLNKYGERFMAKWDPERMEMATRDVVSIACMKEILEGRGGPSGGVFLSWAHLPSNIIDYLPHWYGKPHLRTSWRWEGFDFKGLVEEIKKGRAVEVASASHFFMGGIAIDVSCATNVPGLFACGEVAGGAHGANRLSGNASSQMLVQGRRAGSAAVAYAKRNGWRGLSPGVWDSVRSDVEGPLARDEGVLPFELKALVQDIANRHAGVIRTGKSLSTALEEARRLRRAVLPTVYCRSKEQKYNKEWVEALECRSLIMTLEAVALSALHREESRGAHYRDDFPKEDGNRPLNHGVVALKGEDLLYRSRPVRFTKMKPPGGSAE